jgi:phosphate transport system substrate-binding protein
VYRTITRQPVAIGVHKSLGVSNLSEAQVCDVFSGKAKSWKELGGSDTKVTVLSRKPEDVNMKIFRDKMSCFKSLQLAPDAVLLTRGSELLDSLNNRPGTVGIANVAASMLERANVKPLAVAGVPATLEAVKSGKYKYFGETGFVTPGEPKGAVKRFVDFATGPEAEKVWQKFGMAVVH